MIDRLANDRDLGATSDAEIHFFHPLESLGELIKAVESPVRIASCVIYYKFITHHNHPSSLPLL